MWRVNYPNLTKMAIFKPRNFTKRKKIYLYKFELMTTISLTVDVFKKLVKKD